ncbi:hypothetical protein [Oscillibacter ruminantium]|uniref:hypothetical protein n=1 Tax=Oscillibacter ruminantium TaxID=1263547 RepID=UPI00331E5315
MSKEDFLIMRDISRKNHAERVSKTPDRIQFAINQFELNGIAYTLKNPANGHFHAWDRRGILHQFWASTGKILNSEKRGIRNFVKLILR